jgi:hypothetical protein
LIGRSAAICTVPDCGTNQQWTLNTEGTNRGTPPGLYLDVTAAATTNGTLVGL